MSAPRLPRLFRSIAGAVTWTTRYRLSNGSEHTFATTSRAGSLAVHLAALELELTMFHSALTLKHPLVHESSVWDGQAYLDGVAARTRTGRSKGCRSNLLPTGFTAAGAS